MTAASTSTCTARCTCSRRRGAAARRGRALRDGVGRRDARRRRADRLCRRERRGERRARATPHTTYGMTKACAELLVADYSRRGFVDGRGCRPPPSPSAPARRAPPPPRASRPSSVSRSPARPPPRPSPPTSATRSPRDGRRSPPSSRCTTRRRRRPAPSSASTAPSSCRRSPSPSPTSRRPPAASSRPVGSPRRARRRHLRARRKALRRRRLLPRADRLRPPRARSASAPTSPPSRLCASTPRTFRPRSRRTCGWRRRRRWRRGARPKPAAERAVALVTGGGSGIGQAVAVRLAEGGWSDAASVAVIVAGRRRDALEETAAAVRAAGAEALVCPADLTREDDVARLFEEIQEHPPRPPLQQRGRRAAADERQPRWSWATGGGSSTSLERDVPRLARRLPHDGGAADAGRRGSSTTARCRAARRRGRARSRTRRRHAGDGARPSLSLDGARVDRRRHRSQAATSRRRSPRGWRWTMPQPDGSVRPEPRMDQRCAANAVHYMASLPLGANVLQMTRDGDEHVLVGGDERRNGDEFDARSNTNVDTRRSNGGGRRHAWKTHVLADLTIAGRPPRAAIDRFAEAARGRVPREDRNGSPAVRCLVQRNYEARSRTRCAEVRPTRSSPSAWLQPDVVGRVGPRRRERSPRARCRVPSTRAADRARRLEARAAEGAAAHSKIGGASTPTRVALGVATDRSATRGRARAGERRLRSRRHGRAQVLRATRGASLGSSADARAPRRVGAASSRWKEDLRDALRAQYAALGDAARSRREGAPGTGRGDRARDGAVRSCGDFG